MLVKKLNFQHDNASATLMYFKGLEYEPKSGFYGNEFLTIELICVTISLQHVNIINLRVPGGR